MKSSQVLKSSEDGAPRRFSACRVPGNIANFTACSESTWRDRELVPKLELFAHKNILEATASSWFWRSDHENADRWIIEPKTEPMFVFLPPSLHQSSSAPFFYLYPEHTAIVHAVDPGLLPVLFPLSVGSWRWVNEADGPDDAPPAEEHPKYLKPAL